MREPDFAQEGNRWGAVMTPWGSGAFWSAAMPDRERGPLADAVGGQDRRAARGSGEERGCRVRLVVTGEEDLVPRHAEVRRDDAANPDLFAQRALHGAREGPPGVGKGPQRAGENPLELLHTALVEHHRVEIRRIEAGPIEAPGNRADRKGGVVFTPRQALFLNGAHRHAVDNERRR